MKHDAATQRQIDAARPGRSTWLSANAGSGKTRVLTDRVARLLLDQVDPQNILCLTYTKAAASEMQNRLFRRLGTWAMLPDPDLTEQLKALGIENDITPDFLSLARRLFASAIETPGGLKIQTIHSFCASLLRRFPLEAGVSPQFQEMDERSATLLRSEIIEGLASGPHAQVIEDIARIHGGGDLDLLASEVIRHRNAFAGEFTRDQLAQHLNQSENLSIDQIEGRVFLGREGDILTSLIPALLASGTNDQKAGHKLSNISGMGLRALPQLESVFLYGEKAKSPFSAKIDSFPTKSCKAKLANLMPELEAWMTRVEDARETRLCLKVIDRAEVLHQFAALFLPAYEQAKQTRGWLDFDDLILRARALLTNPDVAAWVLFRLDGGIDHILVDEAQDTSPVQWEVIEKLAQEFTSGEGARKDMLRTIFIVGDKKQSIYSFQGADPREFDRMQDEFAMRLSAAEHPLQSRELSHSFRSSQAILRLVDQVFQNEEKSGFTPEQDHIPFHKNLPGRVDLWPVVEKPDKDETPEWHNPVDLRAPNDPAILLAQEVAKNIRNLVDGQHPIPDQDGMRPVQPGDFLILVQRRSDLFHEIIRECKALNLPVAGADRLKVGAELAVRDLAALLSFLDTPEDSLALATALKSPLFGWTEGDLYELAQGRTQTYLWAELRDRTQDFPQTMEILTDLRDHTDFLRPFELIERILTRHNGRRKLLARLGPEAEDGIDAFLSQALTYETRSVDSLTGFLVWLGADDLEIKRQLDSAGNRIRVMTVHGAKGLEAPIVILPDTGKRDIRLRDQLVVLDHLPVLRSAAGEAPAMMQQANEAARDAEKAERNRLLYVAMTRAEKWLIVAAAGDLGKDGESWYDKIHTGLQAVDAQPYEFSGGQGLRSEHGEWSAVNSESALAEEPPKPELKPFFKQPAKTVNSSIKTLSPSDLGGAKALPGDAGQDEDTAKQRGRQIHTLLEYLPDIPQDEWPIIAPVLLQSETENISDLLQEAEQVLTSPFLTHLFNKAALAEVPVSAHIAALGGRRIHGTIDRLIIKEDYILAVDFKTNAVVPASAGECPEGLLRQMGAYAHALQEIWPDTQIRTALLWTRTATLMELPHDLVTRALCSASLP